MTLSWLREIWGWWRWMSSQLSVQAMPACIWAVKCSWAGSAASVTVLNLSAKTLLREGKVNVQLVPISPPLISRWTISKTYFWTRKQVRWCSSMQPKITLYIKNILTKTRLCQWKLLRRSSEDSLATSTSIIRLRSRRGSTTKINTSNSSYGRFKVAKITMTTKNLFLVNQLQIKWRFQLKNVMISVRLQR